MRVSWRALGVGCSALVLAVAVLPAVADAVAPRFLVADAVATTIARNPVAPTSPVEALVVLSPRRAAALDALLVAQRTPGSAQYRHFLRTGVFAARFGASAAALRQTRAYFSSFGLRVAPRLVDGLILRVRGSASGVARALHATLAVTSGANGRVVLTRDATLPAELRGVVRGVVGLSTPYAAHRRASSAQLVGRTTGPTSCTSSALTVLHGGGGLIPQDQGAAYGLNTLWQQGDTGVSQTIALYELAPYRGSDVATYESCNGVSPQISTTYVDGGTRSPYDLESTLDVEEAAALAPGANLNVYLGPNNNVGPTDLFAQIASDNTSTVVSVSWGICEAQSDATNEAPLFQQMAAQGQTVLAASGDAGSSDCYDGSAGSLPVAVDDPSSQPYVTGVGGTYVTSFTPLVQSAWNDGNGAGGGGFSSSIPRPGWQVATGLDPTGTTRAVPDLSVTADPRNGFVYYFNRGWGVVGGTSIGAPLLSALVADSAQACGVNSLGFLNPRLYQLAAAGVGFNDVTTGSNDLYGVGGYSAGVGYDPVTGLGTPKPGSFASGLCPSVATPANSTVTASASSLSLDGPPLNVTLTVRDGVNIPLTNLPFTVTATEPGATPFVTPSTTTDGNGVGQFSVTTTKPGLLTVRVNVGAVVVGTLTANVTAPLRGTNVTGVVNAVASASPLRTAWSSRTLVVAGRRANGRVAVSWGSAAAQTNDLTKIAGAPLAGGTPDLTCASTCAVAYVSNHHVVVVQRATSTRPLVSDLQKRRVTLPLASAAVVVRDVGDATHLSVAYVSTNQHLIVVRLAASGVIEAVSDVTANAYGTPAFAPTSGGSLLVVYRTAATYAVATGLVGGTWTTRTLVASSAAKSDPAVALDGNVLNVVARTPANHVVVFADGGSASDLGTSSGVPTFVPGAQHPDVVATVGTATLTLWAPTPTWLTKGLGDVAQLPSNSGVVLGSGAVVVVRSGAVAYAVSR